MMLLHRESKVVAATVRQICLVLIGYPAAAKPTDINNRDFQKKNRTETESQGKK